MSFSDEDRKILEQYVSSVDGNVFAVRNLNGIAGAAFARYSRAPGGFRETLLKEFIKNGVVDAKHADELIQRILIAFGDDSVGELEGAHLSFEQISMVATKDIEDRRIGGSPIEQSTRYVLYDEKDAQGNWRYYRGPEILSSSFAEQYVQTMDLIFATYACLIGPLRDHLRSLKPITEAEYDFRGIGVKEKIGSLTEESHFREFRRIYNADLRAKACDILRLLLPLATLTNVGLYGNGRYYQNLLSFQRTSDLPESNRLAGEARTALDQIIPQYVRREARNEYVAGVNHNMYVLSKRIFGDRLSEEPKHLLPSCELLPHGAHQIPGLLKKGLNYEGVLQGLQDIATVAAMLYPYTKMSLSHLRYEVSYFKTDELQEVIDTYLGDRQTRRDRPGRALEDGYPYTFDLVTNFGVYKDLERHRMLTQQRQLFTTKLGFIVPPELEEIGMSRLALECAERAEHLFSLMEKENPVLAQYAPLHGHYVRWSLGCNDRELMHLLELRTTPQGHPNYRLIGQLMHKAVTERSPWRGEAMKFVDHNEYYWSRAESEARQSAKEAQLNKN